MKILPYQEESFFAYRNESAQEFRFVISEQIRQQIFYASLLQNIETNIKSSLLMNALNVAQQIKVPISRTKTSNYNLSF